MAETTSPTVHTALCAALEAAAQKALRHDPGSRYALAKLTGQVLAVELTGPAWTFYLVPHAELGLTIQTQCEADITTRLKGSPMALASLVKSDRVNLFDSGVEVFGSTGLLIELQQIAQQLEIDWEDALSELLGDMPGQAAAKTLRTGFDWLRGRRQSFTRLLGEYVKEELKATPSAPELKNFSTAVDELRLDTDRLDAKFAALTGAPVKPPVATLDVSTLDVSTPGVATSHDATPATHKAAKE